MKRILAFVLIMLISATALCGCGNDPAPDTDKSPSVANAEKTEEKSEKGGNVAVSAKLSQVYEIAATDPHYTISTPDWHAEGYGRGFALNENGNKKYAIAAVCGDGADENSLDTSFSTLYNDDFKGILMQNYRAKYADFALETTEVTLADGSTAIRFSGIQPADDYGTELNCPIYGYGFRYDGVTFIVAYIVMEKSAADDAKCAEMQGYVDEMVNTVRVAQ